MSLMPPMPLSLSLTPLRHCLRHIFADTSYQFSLLYCHCRHAITYAMPPCYALLLFQDYDASAI